MIRNIYYWPIYSHMVIELDHMLRDTVLQVVNKNPEKSLQEPDYTAAIVTEFVQMAKHSSAFAGAKVGGTYIHQRPKVTFTLGGVSKSCELGDLLVLCRKIIDGEARFNAVLMQLKMAHSNDDLTIYNSRELVQLALYTHWPKFKFKYVNGDEYDILPKTVTLGAQYMFVNEFDYPMYTHHIPQKTMSNDDYFSFGRFLYDFVNWQNGRPIADVAYKNTDEWSKLIWNIIEHNKNVYFRRKNIGVEQGQRNVLEFLSEISMNRDGGNQSIEIEQYDDEGLGCPMLFIDYAERQE